MELPFTDAAVTLKVTTSSLLLLGPAGSSFSQNVFAFYRQVQLGGSESDHVFNENLLPSRWAEGCLVAYIYVNIEYGGRLYIDVKKCSFSYIFHLHSLFDPVEKLDISCSD